MVTSSKECFLICRVEEIKQLDILNCVSQMLPGEATKNHFNEVLSCLVVSYGQLDVRFPKMQQSFRQSIIQKRNKS